MAAIQVPPDADAPADTVVHARRLAMIETRDAWPGEKDAGGGVPSGDQEVATEWRPLPYAYLDRLTLAVAPGKSSAEIRYACGRIKREDRSEFATFKPPDLLDKFVRVTDLGSGRPAGEPFRLWTGRVYAADLASAGSTPDADGNRYQTGDLVLTAYGLEQELERCFVRGSFVTVGDGDEAQRIDEPLAFNRRGLRQFESHGNRSAAKVVPPGGDVEVESGKAYAFASDKAGEGSAAKVPAWTLLDVAQHLLAFHGPPAMRFRMAGQLDALRAIEPVALALEGMSVFEALSAVIDRRRGLGWRVVSEGDKDVVQVRVFTTFRDPIQVNGKTVPGNQDRRLLDLDKPGHLAGESRVAVDAFPRVGTIEVRGEPVVACFTLSVADENLVKGWKDDAEAAYKAGPGGNVPADQVEAWRALDRFQHVFTSFVVPDDWDGLAGDGEKGQKVRIHPLVNADGSFDFSGGDGLPRTWGKQFLPSLPVLSEEAVDAETSERFEPEYLRTLAFVRNEKKRWVQTDRASSVYGVSGSVSVLASALGVRVDFGRRHELAKNHWQGARAGTGVGIDPKYDYDDLVVTVAMRLDVRARVTAAVPGVEPWRRKVIDVPGAQVWFLSPGAVTKVDEKGELVPAEEREYVRDDTPRLRDVLALARQWYGLPRASATGTLAEVATHVIPGMLVTDVVDAGRRTAVNSVVTDVTYDFAAQATTFATGYAELDFAETAGGATDPGPAL